MDKKFDLGSMLILFLQDEMIEKGVLPKDFKWAEITKEQEEKVIKFVQDKLEEQKGIDKNVERNSN